MEPPIFDVTTKCAQMWWHFTSSDEAGIAIFHVDTNDNVLKTKCERELILHQPLAGISDILSFNHSPFKITYVICCFSWYFPTLTKFFSTCSSDSFDTDVTDEFGASNDGLLILRIECFLIMSAFTPTQVHNTPVGVLVCHTFLLIEV